MEIDFRQTEINNHRRMKVYTYISYKTDDGRELSKIN